MPMRNNQPRRDFVARVLQKRKGNSEVVSKEKRQEGEYCCKKHLHATGTQRVTFYTGTGDPSISLEEAIRDAELHY
ncbi:OLC1v1008565C1 [Oldenlandia corymbosa var. corymbosa]|uniref:OLC1v1008565C1 n=1 Tax=Oldenlandia corymbosa var. corymbosa TaxID=529605 RepID=A0AAV1DPD8_OLDCO|nr:OLC1v1008565C1 [Oldenlandia corymbosa var. corymbosa]